MGRENPSQSLATSDGAHTNGSKISLRSKTQQVSPISSRFLSARKSSLRTVSLCGPSLLRPNAHQRTINLFQASDAA